MNYALLESAPPHTGPSFIRYLRDNNVVVFDLKYWLVIENCKYHHKLGNRGWLTAFIKCDDNSQAKEIGGHEWEDLFKHMPESWEVLIKAPMNRSVKRFHIHFIEKLK